MPRAPLAGIVALLAAFQPCAAAATLPVPGCIARHEGALPDAACTPGAIETVDLAIVCGQTTRTRRAVNETTRRAVFAAYGIPYPPPPGAYELDHLVSLELGGSNAPENLWPEAADPRPGYRDKDLVENRVHRLVCAGRMPLAEAQRQIAEDWLALVP